MEFEWDEDKRLANIEKHGIDFAGAVTMWHKPIVDPAESRTVSGEERRLALGVVGDDELIVATIYTERDNLRRLISVRRARRNERRYYQDQHGRGR